MTALMLYVLLWLWDNRTFDSITKANQRKLEAEEAYQNRQFARSAALYRQITYGSLFSEPAARLNLAHSYYQNKNFNEAFKHYSLLERIDNKSIASIANSQLALIRVARQDTAGALANLKTAITLEPGNDQARANYIVLKKYFSGQAGSSDVRTKKKMPNPQSLAQQQQQTRPQPPKQDQREVESSARKEELLKSLKQMNMSEDQARAILDAMKSNESQYIYQLRRKQYSKKASAQDEIEW
jgi:tetratricopeptide (TPR) repeat protein